MTSSPVCSAAGSTKSARRYRPCPVCLTEESIHLCRASIAPVDGMDFSYDVVSCNGCGFVYGNNLATKAEYENYYQSTMPTYQLPILAMSTGYAPGLPFKSALAPQALSLISVVEVLAFYLLHSAMQAYVQFMDLIRRSPMRPRPCLG